MRIAVLTHSLHREGEAEYGYAIGLVAEQWREAGHEVRFITERDSWSADLAVLHVDNTVVPARYVRAARQYPVVINGRITDIRKTKVSSAAVWPEPGYQGPVFVKSNLNSAGIPERVLSTRSRWSRFRRWLGRGQGETMDYNKGYAVYDSIAAIPKEVRRRRDIVVQKFLPEIENGHYFVRRCFILGERMICYRMGHNDPIVDAGGPDLFTWIEPRPEIIAWKRKVGLDYGTIDYVLNNGEVVVLDVNKTPGRARPPDEAGQRDYRTIIEHVSAGLYDLITPTLNPAT